MNTRMNRLGIFLIQLRGISGFTSAYSYLPTKISGYLHLQRQTLSVYGEKQSLVSSSFLWHVLVIYISIPVGCHSGTYEYLQKEARDKRQTPSPAKERPSHHSVSENTNFINIPSDDEDSDDEAFSNQLDNQPDTQPSSPRKSSPPQPQASQESEAESDDGGKFKLVLRSDKSAKDITLIVRPTTKCGSIVKAYIKKIGLTDQYPHIFDENGSASAPAAPPTTTRGRGGRGRGGRGRGRGRGKAKVQAETPNVPLSDPRITVDGDRMENDAEIGDADLEDGDMVDVVGL